MLDVNKIEGDPIDVDRVRGVTVKVPIRIFGQNVLAVIDTGAEVTVMCERLLKSLPTNECTDLSESRISLIAAESSKTITTSGKLLADIIIGNNHLKWPVYIAPIQDDILLGCDLFDAYDMTLSMKSGLLVNGEWIECEIVRSPSKLARIYLSEDTTIPPYTELLTMGKMDKRSFLDHTYGITEPLILDTDLEVDQGHCVTIARAVVEPSSKGIPVRLLNSTSESIKLNAGDEIAELHPVEGLVALGEKEDRLKSPNKGHGHCGKHLTGQRCFSPQEPNSTYNLRKFEERTVQAPSIPAEFQVEVEDNKLLYRRGEKDESNESEDGIDSSLQGNAEILAGDFTVPPHLLQLFQDSCKNIKEEKDKQALADILIRNQHAFAKSKTDLGDCSIIKHKINTGESAPIRQPLRRTPRGFEKEEEQYLKEQLEAGVVIPSNSAWSSPVCLVRKKDGSVRWCIDYRKLNDVTAKDAYPLPRIDTCLDCLGSAKFFSTVDMQSGYWQLQVVEEDRPKTAFITKYGLFEYRKLPFGLCGAPSTFERCMELVLRGLQWKTLLIYLDDIIIFSSNLEEHLQRLEEVLKRLSEAKLKLKPSKCHLLETEVLFLGHIVGQTGVKPNPQLIKSVMDWKAPTSTKQVQQFLGLANYYRRFIKNFSDIAAPLSHLTKKDVKFQWTSDCQIAMEKLKLALCRAPVLAYPQPGGGYTLDCDASDVGIGAVLSQTQAGVEKVICYGSKKLDRAQRNYCVTRKELLAVITFVTQYRHYLLGQHFNIRTDHSSLRWLCNFKEPGGQIARWLEVLAEYNFTIIHRDGKKHQNADALSRKHCGDDGCNFYKQGEILAELPCGGCPKCKKKHSEWAHFEAEVNDVIPLASKAVDTDQNLHTCRRMTTRSLGKSKIDTSEDFREMWFQGHSSTSLAQFQREDPIIGILHIWIDENQKPNRDEIASLKPALRKYWLNWDNITKKDGVLYQKWYFPDVEKAPCLQFLVPKVLQREILTHCHNSTYAAHLGIVKTKAKIKQRFYWYRMGTDISLHIRQCPECSTNSNPQKRPKATLMDYRVGAPMDRIGIDILGPLPTSNQGNTCLLVVGDYFTRWIEAYPMSDQQAETTANHLVFQFFSRFGIPYEIHSDQGRNFESRLFQEICHLLEIKKTRSTPYRPQSNGLIERFNRTLGKMIRSFIASNIYDWDVHIPLLTAAYRSTRHPATGFTPNKLMLGREVNLPIDILYPRPSSLEPLESHEYVAQL